MGKVEAPFDLPEPGTKCRKQQPGPGCSYSTQRHSRFGSNRHLYLCLFFCLLRVMVTYLWGRQLHKTSVFHFVTSTGVSSGFRHSKRDVRSGSQFDGTGSTR